MWTWLFAASSGFNAISRHIHRRKSPADFMIYVAAIMTIGLLWAAYSWMERSKKPIRQVAHNPHSLFLELCQAHRLVRAERTLLQQAMEKSPPSERCQVFIDPRILGRLSIANTIEADSYAKLSRKLFGEPLI